MKRATKGPLLLSKASLMQPCYDGLAGLEGLQSGRSIKYGGISYENSTAICPIILVRRASKERGESQVYAAIFSYRPFAVLFPDKHAPAFTVALD